jgi:hypothetical protein
MLLLLSSLFFFVVGCAFCGHLWPPIFGRAPGIAIVFCLELLSSSYIVVVVWIWFSEYMIWLCMLVTQFEATLSFLRFLLMLSAWRLGFFMVLSECFHYVFSPKIAPNPIYIFAVDFYFFWHNKVSSIQFYWLLLPFRFFV